MSDIKNSIAAVFLGLGLILTNALPSLQDLIIGKAIAIVYPGEHQQLLDHANS